MPGMIIKIPTGIQHNILKICFFSRINRKGTTFADFALHANGSRQLLGNPRLRLFRSYDRNQALEKHGEDSSPDSLPGDFAVSTERDASVEAW